LIVPSAVTPNETNLLLNPRHADLKKFVMHPPEPLVFDPRLRKKGRERQQRPMAALFP
jgi:RES domain-containing protein